MQQNLDSNGLYLVLAMATLHHYPWKYWEERLAAWKNHWFVHMYGGDSSKDIDKPETPVVLKKLPIDKALDTLPNVLRGILEVPLWSFLVEYGIDQLALEGTCV